MEYTIEYYQKSADAIRKLVPWEPEIAVVLGSFLGPFADAIEDPIVIDYKIQDGYIFIAKESLLEYEKIPGSSW